MVFGEQGVVARGCSSGWLVMMPSGARSISLRVPTVWGLRACEQHTVNFCSWRVCRTAQRTWLGMLSVALGEDLKLLDFSQWLKYY